IANFKKQEVSNGRNCIRIYWRNKKSKLTNEENSDEIVQQIFFYNINNLIHSPKSIFFIT
ncbi:MAG TPA: hypothetical protein PK007_05675, partial [Candidatus Kapabacteria bacterium]|nr:hypothetical protein [Candidatus Kapabacteria bacterium]